MWENATVLPELVNQLLDSRVGESFPLHVKDACKFFQPVKEPVD